MDTMTREIHETLDRMPTLAFPLLPHLRGNNLFVPGVALGDSEALITALGMGPVGVALTGGGELLIGTTAIPIPAVESLPQLSCRLTLNERMFKSWGFCTAALGMDRDDERVKPLKERVCAETVEVSGVALRLPAWLLGVQSAFETYLATVTQAPEKKKPYDWERFFADYRRDLAAEVGKQIEGLVLATPRRCLQAQAGMDPRVGIDEVGLCPADAQRLGVEGGRKVVLGRFPGGGKHSFRYVTILLLPDQEEGMLYVNPDAWQHLHGGDTDGDLGYVLVEGEEAEAAREAGPYPTLVLTDSRSVLAEVRVWSPLAADAALQLVMSKLIKTLTGSLTHTFHVLARAAAVAYVRNGEFPGTREEKILKAYRGVFEVFEPLLEEVMDARKGTGKEAELRHAAQALQSVMAGGVLQTDAFDVFLSGTLPQRFRAMVRLASGMNGEIATLSACRNTAVGRLIAAGRGGRSRATEKVIERLLQKGIAPGAILPTLQRDATGEEFHYLSQGRGQVEEESEGSGSPERFGAGDPGGTVKQVLESLTWEGRRVITLLETRSVGSGQIDVKLRVTPWWQEGKIETVLIRLVLVDPELGAEDPRRLTKDGHAIVALPGCKSRVYRPALSAREGVLVMETLAGWLQRGLLAGLRLAWEQHAREDELESLIYEGVLKAYMDLPLIRQKSVLDLSERETALALIGRAEYRVAIEEKKDTLTQWAQMEEVLRLAQAAGFDILSTSKNRPGEVIYKPASEELGVPSYLLAINPFARYLDPKRRPEPREIKSREPLYWKDGIRLPTVRTKGIKLPLALAEGVKEVVCLIADTNLNVWTSTFTGKGFCHDTLLGTAALLETLKLRMFDLEAATLEEYLRILADLKVQGFTDEEIKVTPREDRLDTGGLVAQSWVITVVASEGIRDLGKIKACVGPVKGVPSMLPGVRLFAGGREIELIVPRDTIVRKKGLDFWLSMAHEALAYAQGVESVEVDPREELEGMLARITAGLERQFGNPDGLVEITDQDGNVLGTGFVGAVPFFRPVQTKIGTFRVRDDRHPIEMELHSALMAGSSLTLTTEENARFTGFAEAFRDSLK